MFRSTGLSLLLIVLVACGGSDSAPGAPSPQPQRPGEWRLSGTVVDTLSGEAVSGATLSFSGGASIAATGNGAWMLEGTGTSSNPTVTVAAPGYVTRETTVRWSSGGRADVRLDLIADRSPFTLTFFRQFVRNGFEEPDSLKAIRRWTRAPNFYVDARNPQTQQPLTSSEVASIQNAIRQAVPQVTGGQFEAGTIEIATQSRARRADYVNVVFVHEPDGDYCGQALVGANPGEITMNYDLCRSTCGAFSPETLAHEVGHAMGFWHTNGPGIMHPDRIRRCSNLQFSDTERLHARVAYARPPGNTDTDRDPATFAAADTGGETRIVCRR
jgi:hypothetical protein